MAFRLELRFASPVQLEAHLVRYAEHGGVIIPGRLCPDLQVPGPPAGIEMEFAVGSERAVVVGQALRREQLGVVVELTPESLLGAWRLVPRRKGERSYTPQEVSVRGVALGRMAGQGRMKLLSVQERVRPGAQGSDWDRYPSIDSQDLPPAAITPVGERPSSLPPAPPATGDQAAKPGAEWEPETQVRGWKRHETGPGRASLVHNPALWELETEIREQGQAPGHKGQERRPVPPQQPPGPSEDSDELIIELIHEHGGEGPAKEVKTPPELLADALSPEEMTPSQMGQRIRHQDLDIADDFLWLGDDNLLLGETTFGSPVPPLPRPLPPPSLRSQPLPALRPEGMLADEEPLALAQGTPMPPPPPRSPREGPEDHEAAGVPDPGPPSAATDTTPPPELSPLSPPEPGGIPPGPVFELPLTAMISAPRHLADEGASPEDQPPPPPPEDEPEESASARTTAEPPREVPEVLVAGPAPGSTAKEMPALSIAAGEAPGLPVPAGPGPEAAPPKTPGAQMSDALPKDLSAVDLLLLASDRERGWQEDVVLHIVHHPNAAPGLALRLLGRLSPGGLRAVAADPGLPPVISTAARRRLERA